MPTHAHTVVAIRYGELLTSRSDVYLNYGDYAEPDGPDALSYYFWVIEGGERTVVLDTGFGAEVGPRRGRRLLLDPREAFSALGVADAPETTVVISHAHYDHIGNLAHFREASFVMARAEWDYWLENATPLATTHRVAEPDEIAHLRTLRDEGRLRLLDADEEIAPGIRAVHAPGHTPGQLMLLVDTLEGRLLLTADAVHTDEELERRMPFRHMCELPAAAATYELIDALARDGVRVVVGHEHSLVDRFTSDPRLPEHSLVLSDPDTPKRKAP